MFYRKFSRNFTKKIIVMAKETPEFILFLRRPAAGDISTVSAVESIANCD